MTENATALSAIIHCRLYNSDNNNFPTTLCQLLYLKVMIINYNDDENDDHHADAHYYND